MMLTDMQSDRCRNPQAMRQKCEISSDTQGFYRECNWRQFEHGAGAQGGDIAISRWTDPQNTSRQEEATTPCDQYFIGIALKATRLTLTRGWETIFDGIMPTGTLYVAAPSKQLCARFHAPYDFLHFSVPSHYLPLHQSAAQLPAAEGLNDLVLLRDPLAEQLARALTDGNTVDEEFAHCIGRTLAMYVARIESPRTKNNALSKWRLRRVEEYVKAHFDRGISLADLARVAGLSPMHFAAQFRFATGYRPHEYLRHQRIKHAKLLLSSTETPLVEIALAVGFCTQAHFSTVFKRITNETPARWRCASKNKLPTAKNPAQSLVFDKRASSLCRVDEPA